MTPKLQTRDVTKLLYINYLKRAEECLHAAKNSFDNQEWNAAFSINFQEPPNFSHHR